MARRTSLAFLSLAAAVGCARSPVCATNLPNLTSCTHCKNDSDCATGFFCNGNGFCAPSGSGAATCQTNGGTTCQTVGDCLNQTNFFCSAASNCCVFVCKTSSDCGDASLGDPNDPCTASPLGCVCDQGVCESLPCSADAECPDAGLICKGGVCQPPDSASSAATILVAPNPAILHAGAVQQFTATVLDANGQAVILAPGGVTWTVSGHGTITPGGSFMPSGASTAFGDTVVTATAGTVSGTAIATVYASPDAGLRLVLIDAAASIPVTDATVVWSDASGNLIDAGVVTGGDLLGQYALPPSPAKAALLNVFEPNYRFVSVPVTALPASGDIVLFLAQNSIVGSLDGVSGPVTGGYTGDFTTEPGILNPNDGEPVSQTGDIHLALGGTTLPQNPLDITAVSIFGPPHGLTINIGGSHLVQLPQGLELGFGTTYFTCSYAALGGAGGCGLPPCVAGQSGADGGCLSRETYPGKPDWPESVFACGRRSAWGLGGNLPFSAISPELGNLDSSSLDSFWNVAVWDLLPALEGKGAESGVFFQAPYTVQPLVPANKVVDSCTGAPFTDATPIPNPASLNDKIPLQLATPAGLEVTVTLPALPALGPGSPPGNCQTNALVLAGAVEPGLGLLPLGFSSATILNTSNNPSTNCRVLDSYGEATGNVLTNVAPEHGGVERDRYGVVALSLDPASIVGSGGTEVSGVVQTLPSLPFGQTVDFAGASFPAYLTNAGYDAATRTFTNDTINSGGAAWEQLLFTDELGNGWVIYFPPATVSFVLPKPPGDDPTVTSASGVSPVVQQVVTNGLTLPGLLDFTNGPVATDLMDQVTGFSSVGIDCLNGGGC